VPVTSNRTALPPPHERRQRASRGKRQADWRDRGRRLPGSSTRVLAAAFLGFGVGIVAGAALSRLVPDAPIASSLAVWVGLVLPIMYFFVRVNPVGLMRFRAVDVIWALGFSLLLRSLQWVSAAGWTQPFPNLFAIDGSLLVNWWFILPAAGMVGPTIEEIFFRGVIVVTVFEAVRSRVGIVGASLTSILASAGGFILLHAAFDQLASADAFTLFALAAVCAALVIMTGRIWGAILIHVFYNGVYVLVLVVGTLLA
jgi:membrane protease YdiL (CAAX protease family)